MGRTGGKRGRKKDKEGVAKVKRRIKGGFLVGLLVGGYRHTHTHTLVHRHKRKHGATVRFCALRCAR